MNERKSLPLLWIIIIAGIVAIFYFSTSTKEIIAPVSQEDMYEEDYHSHDHEEDYEDIHYHAGFWIFVDGEKQDYSDLEYMKISPCSTDYEDTKIDLTDPIERIHLHEFVGNVAHIHTEDVKWRELFISLGIENILEKEPQAFFRNGERVENLLDEVVQSYEGVTMYFGELPDFNSKNIEIPVVTKEEILEAEKIIETCS